MPGVLAEALSEVREKSLLMITVWFSDFIMFPTIPSHLEYGAFIWAGEVVCCTLAKGILWYSGLQMLDFSNVAVYHSPFACFAIERGTARFLLLLMPIKF